MALPKEVKFVTFDCYGTLIDWESGVYDAFQKEADRDGFTDRPRRADPALHRDPARDPARLLRALRRGPAPHGGAGRGRARLGARALALQLPARQRAAWPPFRETNAQLERFAKKYEIGILSNIDDKLLGATRRHFRIDFDLVVTAQQVRSYKPDPAHFKECARRIEELKKNWVHIASGYPTDVEPCLKSKIPVIWVNRHGEELEAAEEAGRRGQDLPRRRQAAEGRLRRRCVRSTRTRCVVTSRDVADQRRRRCAPAARRC